ADHGHEPEDEVDAAGLATGRRRQPAGDERERRGRAARHEGEEHELDDGPPAHRARAYSTPGSARHANCGLRYSRHERTRTRVICVLFTTPCEAGPRERRKEVRWDSESESS